MNPLRRAWRGARAAAAHWAARHAARLALAQGDAAERWLRVAARLAPEFGRAHRELVAARRRAGDRLGALAISLRVVRRHDHSAEAWILLGEAYAGAFRPDDAIQAYERALHLEERADAALAVGHLYARKGDVVTAGARFARAYAAGAGPEALRANAKALRAAGDIAAAQQAQQLWEQETGLSWTDS
jgi:tetratricopeptide (TPR) repeat protein